MNFRNWYCSFKFSISNLLLDRVCGCLKFVNVQKLQMWEASVKLTWTDMITSLTQLQSRWIWDYLYLQVAFCDSTKHCYYYSTWRNTTVWKPGHAIKKRFFCVVVGTKDISNVRKRLVAGRDGSIRNSCWNYRPFLCSASLSKRSSVPLSTTDNGNIGFISGPVWLEESIQFF